MEKKLLEYVEQELKRGVSTQMVKKALLNAGWDDHLIEEAFAMVQTRETPPLPRAQLAEGEDAITNDDDDYVPAETHKPGKRLLFIIVGVVLVLALVAGGAYWYFNMRVPAAEEDAGNISSPVVSDETGNPPAPADPANQLMVVDNASTTNNTNNIPDGASKPVGVNSVPSQPVVPVTPVTPAVTAATTTTEGKTDAAARDNQRMADMQKLADAQKTWYGTNKVYYTCGLSSGDCKGKPYGYPVQIGSLEKTPQDPLIGARPVCGKDYVYCGLNNAPYPQFFCYYAKLESGGYYTASHAGNFKRSAPPKIFEDCSAN